MRRGFTLAELLIALTILGVIATFTIPKVLQSQADGKYKAIAKEAAGYMSAAFDAHKFKSGVQVGDGIYNLTPYINYVAVDTRSTIDNEYTDTTLSCSAGWMACLKLHNGAILAYPTSENFAGTYNTSAVWFHIDPDAKVTDGTTNGPGKGITMWLYYDGRLKDRSGINPQACDGSNCYGPNANMVPPWFSWN